MGPFWTNEPGSVLSVSSEFWLYWAVALPLTTVVMVIWQTWLWIYRKRQMRRLKDIEEAAAPAPDESVRQTTQSPSPSVFSSASSSTTRSVYSSERSRNSQYGVLGNVSMEQRPGYDQHTPLNQQSGSFVSARSARTQSQASRTSPTSHHSQPSIASQSSQHSRKIQ